MRVSTLLAMCLFACGSIGHGSAATKKTASAYGVLGVWKRALVSGSSRHCAPPRVTVQGCCSIRH
jgi:hypothetical protein